MSVPYDVGNRNNFDVLRLLLALSVMLVHVHILSGAEELGFVDRLFNSRDAVFGFFVISGYLISMSYGRSRSVLDFVIKRGRRVLPGYVVVVLFCALVGTFWSSMSTAEYFRSKDLFRYLAANLTFLNFLQPSLPGLFTENPYGAAVNGSLWSIRSELACYATVPVISWLVVKWSRIAGVRVAVVVAVLLSCSLLWMVERTGSTSLNLLKVSVADTGYCFALGVACWHYKELLAGRLLLVLGAAAVVWLTVGLALPPWGETLCRPIVVMLGIMFVGLRVPYLGDWNRFGDLSYGIYIYHFPVIQGIVASGGFERSPLLGMIMAVLVTMSLAVTSWHFVELPWLRRDNHYRRSWRGNGKGLKESSSGDLVEREQHGDGVK